MPPKAAPAPSRTMALVKSSTVEKCSTKCYICGRDRGVWRIIGGTYDSNIRNSISSLKTCLVWIQCESCFRKSFTKILNEGVSIDTGVAVFPFCRIMQVKGEEEQTLTSTNTHKISSSYTHGFPMKFVHHRKLSNIDKDSRKKVEAYKTLKKISSNREFGTMTKGVSVAEMKKAFDEKVASPPMTPVISNGVTGPGAGSRSDRFSQDRRNNVDKLLKEKRSSVGEGGADISKPSSRPPTPPLPLPHHPSSGSKVVVPPEVKSVLERGGSVSGAKGAGAGGRSSSVTDKGLPSTIPVKVEEKRSHSMVPVKKEEEASGWFSGWFGGGKKKKEDTRKKDEHNEATLKELENKLGKR